MPDKTIGALTAKASPVAADLLIIEDGSTGDARKTNWPIAAAVADIATPGTATAEDCANKINELLASLRAAKLLQT